MRRVSTEALPLSRSEHVVIVRQTVRQRAVELGFSIVDQTKMVTAASELARNTLTHGGGGSATLEIVQDGVRRGLMLTFEDQGPGHVVGAAADMDGDRAEPGVGGAGRADGVARGEDAGEGAVGLLSVGGGELAGPGIIAVGCDVEIQRGKDGGGQEKREDPREMTRTVHGCSLQRFLRLLTQGGERAARCGWMSGCSRAGGADRESAPQSSGEIGVAR